MRALEVFAGAGGSLLGYKNAGFRSVMAVENDGDAVRTLMLNNPDLNVYEGCVRKFIRDYETLKCALGRIDHVSSIYFGFRIDRALRCDEAEPMKKISTQDSFQLAVPGFFQGQQTPSDGTEGPGRFIPPSGRSRPNDILLHGSVRECHGLARPEERQISENHLEGPPSTGIPDQMHQLARLRLRRSPEEAALLHVRREEFRSDALLPGEVPWGGLRLEFRDGEGGPLSRGG